MRTWSVVGKYPIYDDDGQISHTEIAIASTTSGYATFSQRIVGDQLAKSEKDLVNFALEALFKSEFADRAMAESVQKIDELEAVTKAAKKFMQEAEEKMSSMAKSQEALEARLSEADDDRRTRFEVIETKFNVLNGSFTEMLTDYYSRLEEEEAYDEDSNEAD